MNLQARGFRPDNAYRFINRLVASNQPRNSVVVYRHELENLEAQVKEYLQLVSKLTVDLDALKSEYQETKRELKVSTKEVKVVTKQFNTAKKQVTSLQRSCDSILADYDSLEKRVEGTEEQNHFICV